MLLKLGFKAMLPLVATAGLVGYMIYMNGGDPMAEATKIASKLPGRGAPSEGLDGGSAASTADRGYTPQRSFGASISATVAATLGKARQGVSKASASLGIDSDAEAVAGGNASAYRWLDSSGVVQFGDVPPADAIDVRPVTLRKGNTVASEPPVAQAAKAREPVPISMPRGMPEQDIARYLTVGN